MYQHGFPRLYAAASLKRLPHRPRNRIAIPFSAALCRGLIEAWEVDAARRAGDVVFRGFMPRPH